VGISVYNVRSLLVSLMLWTVQAACSPIRLLTPQGLDLERALPDGCMTTPSPVSSAISCSARTVLFVLANIPSQRQATCIQRRGAVGAQGSFLVCVLPAGKVRPSFD